MILPGAEVRLTGLLFLGYSFFLILKMIFMFPLFQSARTASAHHDLSNRMDSGLVASSVSSGPVGRSHQVLWTCSPSDSLDGIELNCCTV